MASQEQNAPPSTWSKTKGGFQVVGKGAGAARSGINNGLSKLDNMKISSKGVSFKKEMSGQNISYDRDNHVSRPKIDVSHLPPPPRRIPGQAPAAKPIAARASLTGTRPAAPTPAARASPPVPQAPRPTAAGGRVVPPPPPAVAPKSTAEVEEPLPVYTPTVNDTASSGMMGQLSSRMSQMKTSSPGGASSTSRANSTTPSMNEAKSAFSSAKTVGGLYGKYGNQQPGQKTQTPSWSEVKAGASAAQNLHSLHGKYGPKDTSAGSTGTTPAPVPVLVAAPKPLKPNPSTLSKAPLPTPSPKPPLPKGKPQLGPPKEYCIGLYSFDAQAEGDLSFGIGDKIEVLERTNDPDAWWKGRLNGLEGIFPGNYCRLETN